VYGQASVPASISVLPANVPIPNNCISLFADDRTKEQGYVIVYLVNNSKDTIILASQDGAVNIMLEAKDKAGNWKRCQLYIKSFCGNSYYSIHLLPGMFTKINGLYPDSGFTTKLRYGLYDGNYSPRIESNAIEGFVKQDMIDESQNDPMSITQGDYDYVKNIVLGNIIVPANKYKYGPVNAMHLAIERLVEFSTDSSFAVLKHLMNDKNTSINSKYYAVSNLFRLKQAGINEFLIGLLNDTSGTPDSFIILKGALYSLSKVSKSETLQIYKNILTSKYDKRKECIWEDVCNELEDESMKLSLELRQQALVNIKDSLQYKNAYRAVLRGKHKNIDYIWVVYLKDSTLFKAFSDNRNDYTNPAIEYIMKGYCLFKPAGADDYLMSVKNNSAIPDKIRSYAEELYKKRKRFQ
jgi:hypothetical protein